jgi:alpha-ketoglutarate-dependent taurine dioxygenase
MTTLTRTRFEVVPLTEHIGAEIRGLDLRERPDDETVSAIYQAWLDHLVIVFPGQNLSQEDLIRVTGYFGELGELSRPAKYFPKGYSRLLPGIMLISNIRENGEPIGALPDGEMMFHHDMIHAEVPSKATLLYSVEIPSSGGNTLFASGYAAYDTLDPAIRRRLEGRKAMHHYNYGSTQRGDDRGTVAFAECTHPAFRIHEDTGRKAIYVNRLMTVGIVDMPPAESRAAARGRVRPCREAGFRLRARLARGRSPAVGQSLLVARPHRLPLERTPAHAAHHGQGDGAALLSRLAAASAVRITHLSCQCSRMPGEDE